MRDFAADFPAPATQVARVLVVLFLAGCAERSTESATRDSELVQTISVGGPGGASEETFGRVEDVRAAEGGGFFVFDRHSPSIIWFSSDGHYLGGVREAGEGPGELSRPIAIAPTRDDGLAVLDPGSGRISFYRASPDGLAFQNQSFTTWPMTFSTGQGFCAVGDRFFAAGARGEHLLHEIGPEGETLQSFGTAEEASDAEFGPFAQIVVPQLSTGRLLCLEEAERLLLARPFTGQVQAFSLAGELLWERSIPGIYPRKLVVTDSGLATERTAAEGSHQLLSIAKWTEHTIIVQYEWRASDATSLGSEQAAIVSVELRTQDGGEVARRTELSRIADMKRGRIFAFENFPHPRVWVMERRD